MVRKSYLKRYVLGFTMACMLCQCTALIAYQQQEEKTAHAYTQDGHLEIKANSPAPHSRVISIKLNGQILKEFETSSGGTRLDVLATYAGHGGDYIVLRTHMGQGACVGTDVYVLTIYSRNEATRAGRVEVSPKLSRCMGEIPSVSFDSDDRGSQIVAVAGHELRNSKWREKLKSSAR